MLLCLEKWTSSLDDDKSVDVAYFDKVSHKLLLIKLKAYGIDGRLLALIAAYLQDRKQRVAVGDAKSSWLELSAVQPKGRYSDSFSS